MPLAIALIRPIAYHQNAVLPATFIGYYEPFYTSPMLPDMILFLGIPLSPIPLRLRSG